MTNKVQEYGKEINKLYDKTFESCLREYIYQEEEELPSADTFYEQVLATDSYTIVHYLSTNKRAFVRKDTKEVIFEVGYSLPKWDWDGVLVEEGSVWCTEYWK
jgi:hypothetical protein